MSESSIPAIPSIHEDAPEPAIIQLAKPAGGVSATPSGGNADASAMAAREAAFNAEFSWHGQLLNPFSVSRSALFAQHRVAMGAPDLGRCLDDLDAFFADACRILWLCSHQPTDWAILRSQPAELQNVIDQWTDQNVQGNEMAAVTLLGLQIFNASSKNEHETAPSAPRVTHGADLGN